MKKEEYEKMSLVELKELAKARGLKGLSAQKKSSVIEALLQKDAQTQSASDKEDGSQKKVSPESGARAEENVRKVIRGEGESGSARPGVRSEGEVGSARPGVRSEGESGSTRLGVRSEGESGSARQGVRSEGEVGSARPGVRSEGENGSTRPGVRSNTEGNRRVFSNRGFRTEYGSDGETGDGRNGARFRTRRENGTEMRRPEYSGNDVRRTGYTGNDARRTGYAGNDARRTGYTGNDARRTEYTGNDTGRTEYAGNDTKRTEYTENDVRRTETTGNDVRRTEYTGNEERIPQDLSALDSGVEAHGVLEIINPDGFGFIRSDNFLSGENDVYVSPSQIRKFNLRTGDVITGNTRVKTMQEKYSALLYLKTINGMQPSEAMKRYKFEDMTPIFPDERLSMERGSHNIAMRIVDLFSPIGKGQRGMIVSPPKAGKTTLLKDIAHSILENDPQMELLILLIDERPEEVTDIKEAICGEHVEVIYSTFDEQPEHHKRVSEMVIERAKRLVEQKKDVTILLDSITRLARAYNLTVPPSGRTLSGGLDPAALYMPKRFFGAARNMREGGSLTILATALVDTGSKMDDVVYEEFKGTGNMELVLDRKLSERRVFPALDIQKSGTRREDLLLDREEQEAVYIMRKALNGMKSEDAVENILNMFVHTKTNRELVQQVRRQKSI